MLDLLIGQIEIPYVLLAVVDREHVILLLDRYSHPTCPTEEGHVAVATEKPRD